MLACPDAEIVGFDAGFFGSCLTGTHTVPEVLLDQPYLGDVREFDTRILDATDFVVHLAAISNDPISNIYEKITCEINHAATVKLAGAARAAGVRAFVFASSCSMYGFADSGARTEGSSLDPLTAYAKSKVLAENDLRQLATPDVRVTSLRFATACGMSPRLRRRPRLERLRGVRDRWADGDRAQRWQPVAAAGPRSRHATRLRVGASAR